MKSSSPDVIGIFSYVNTDIRPEAISVIITYHMVAVMRYHSALTQ